MVSPLTSDPHLGPTAGQVTQPNFRSKTAQKGISNGDAMK